MKKTIKFFLAIFVFAFISTALVMAWGQKADPNNIKVNDDLRAFVLKMHGVSIENSDLTNKYDVLIKTSFDTQTKWPPKDKLPKNFDPKKIMEIGKDPGLGIKELHKAGITGKGVKVAIIDQPLLTGHEEYKNKAVKYTMVGAGKEELKDNGWKTSGHGPAVASLFVGKSCGVAPGASLYYWAEPMWKMDYKYPIDILEEIITYNKNKPLADKIRVVSFSLGYCPDFKNFKLWNPALKKAKENGLIVIHCGKDYFGAACPVGKDRNDSKNYTACSFQKNESKAFFSKMLGIPIDNRTYASGFGGNKDYSFDGVGGYSWGAPYLAGVITLGLQINPNLTEDTIYKYLRETGTPFNGGFVINPPKFIQKIKQIK